MGFLAVVEDGARNYPALLPLVLISVALTLWASERKNWLWAWATGLVGCLACLLYVESPARADARPGVSGAPASLGRFEPAKVPPATGAATRTGTAGASIHALLDPGRFSSGVRLHPRFPRDFPMPREFRLESNSGGARSGNLTARFRFLGEAANAVCDLRSEGRSNGWTVEILAPHRMVFRKDRRVIEAWFSYPAHSLVLDIPDDD